MARRRAAGRGARGGEVVPTARSARGRVAAGAAALAACAGTGAWFVVLAEAGYLARVNVLVTLLALALLSGGLAFRVAAAVPAAVGLLGGEYVAILAFETEALDTRAPLVAGALLAVAELAYWSLELHGPVVDEAGTGVRRVAQLALLVLGAVTVGTVVLAAVELVAAGGPALDVLGAAAALAALGLVAVAARRTG